MTSPTSRDDAQRITYELNSIGIDNDTWLFTNDDLTGAPTFDSVEEFEAYINSINDIEGEMSFEETSNPEIKIASFSFSLTWNADLDINIYQQMGNFFQQIPYEVTSVESETSGLDFHLFWEP